MSGLSEAVNDDDIQRLRYIAEVLEANAQKYTIPSHVHGYADFLRTFADEITRLTARVAELEGALSVERKHSQAMHRRAQIALAVHQSAVSILNNWKSLNAKRPWPEGFLFGVALNDIKRARERIEAKLEPKP